MAKTIIEEIDDDEYEDIQEAKRHSEMMSVMKEVSNALKENKSKPLEDLLNKNNELIGKFVSAISNIKQDAPQVSVQVNQDKVISALQKISESIVASNSELLIEFKKYNDRPIVESFKLVKDNYGNTKSVDLVYKNNNEYGKNIITKTKYQA